MRRLPTAFFAVALSVSACARAGHERSETAPPSTAPRAIAVYRAVAESIYVGTTKRVVAVATTSLDSACTSVTCADLAARWGVETLWWAHGDSSEARDARADLLARAAPPFDVHAVAVGQAMLLEADAGDVPREGATAQEWIRFRAAHADASGAVRMSPVGFSRSGRTAVTFVDWRCGPTCGHTLGVALTATSDSSWAIAEMLLVTSRNR
jgi:type IV secretory pathway TrbD component